MLQTKWVARIEVSLMRLTRLLLGAAGVVLVLVGAWHLLGTGLSDLVDIALWLAGGVVVHDA